jgi:hypothetical protein
LSVMRSRSQSIPSSLLLSRSERLNYGESGKPRKIGKTRKNVALWFKKNDTVVFFQVFPPFLVFPNRP